MKREKKMKNKRKCKLRDISLCIKIPVFICSVLAILIGIVGMTLYGYYYHLSSETVKKSMESVMAMNERDVVNFLDTIFTAIEVVNNNDEAYYTSRSNELSNIAYQIITYEQLEDQSNLYENIQLLSQNRNTLKNLFQIAENQSRDIMEVSLLIAQEYPITHLLGEWRGIGKKTTDIVKSRKAEQTEWYQKAVEAEGENYWFFDKDYPDKIFLAKQLTYRCLDEKKEYSIQQLGVILVGISMQWLDTYIKMAELTEGTQIYLTDAVGNVFYKAGDTSFSADIVSNYIVKENEELQYKVLNDSKYLIQKNDVGYGLCLMTVIPIYEIDKMTFQMVRVIVIVCSCVLLFGILFMVMLSRWMLKPVVKLSAQMEKGVVKTIEVIYAGNDEIGRLYQNYNSMLIKIQDLLQKIWEQAEEKKNAEIHALQMQINPHFIFNTLSTISCVALMNGQDTIAEQLKLLSSLIRYNIKNPDGLVSLKNEICMIQNYEKIQKFSFYEGVTFEYHVMQECEKILIPKLIIQPLVENAIVHGGKHEERTVRISVKKKEDWLYISVIDSGINVDTNWINRYIRGENICEVDKESFGIRNVYDRIHLIYGENGNLEYRNTAEGCTEALVTIYVK